MRMIGSMPSFWFSNSSGLTLVAFFGVFCLAYKTDQLVLEGDVNMLVMSGMVFVGIAIVVAILNVVGFSLRSTSANTLAITWPFLSSRMCWRSSSTLPVLHLNGPLYAHMHAHEGVEGQACIQIPLPLFRTLEVYSFLDVDSATDRGCHFSPQVFPMLWSAELNPSKRRFARESLAVPTAAYHSCKPLVMRRPLPTPVSTPSVNSKSSPLSRTSLWS
jgi:hypothetical protein